MIRTRVDQNARRTEPDAERELVAFESMASVEPRAPPGVSEPGFVLCPQPDASTDPRRDAGREQRISDRVIDECLLGIHSRDGGSSWRTCRYRLAPAEREVAAHPRSCGHLVRAQRLGWIERRRSAATGAEHRT